MINASFAAGTDIQSFDPLSGKFVFKFRGREFIASKEGTKFDLFSGRDKKHIGVIRVGSPNSGAIWKKDECIGEYIMDERGKYSVIPIKEGFKSPSVISITSPLTYLLDKI